MHRRKFALRNPGPPGHPPGNDDASLPSFLQANYFPTATEGTFRCRVVEGALPKDISGIYTRNGPNPRFSTSGIPYHPFDGDGMIHSVTFDGGACLPCCFGVFDSFCPQTSLPCTPKSG